MTRFMKNTVKNAFSLFFRKMCFRPKDREMRAREKVNARFEKNLDIRSFVTVYTNLSLLIRVLLTKK